MEERKDDPAGGQPAGHALIQLPRVARALTYQIYGSCMQGEEEEYHAFNNIQTFLHHVC
jgi:hypothetical protein